MRGLTPWPSNIDGYSCESFYRGYGMANCNAVI